MNDIADYVKMYTKYCLLFIRYGIYGKIYIYIYQLKSTLVKDHIYLCYDSSKYKDRNGISWDFISIIEIRRLISLIFVLNGVDADYIEQICL